MAPCICEVCMTCAWNITYNKNMLTGRNIDRATFLLATPALNFDIEYKLHVNQRRIIFQTFVRYFYPSHDAHLFTIIHIFYNGVYGIAVKRLPVNPEVAWSITRPTNLIWITFKFSEHVIDISQKEMAPSTQTTNFHHRWRFLYSN